ANMSKKDFEYVLLYTKNIHLRVDGIMGIEAATITSGGVSVKNVNPSTMESKIDKGIYFAGEMLDVDAFTGGYNLQIAFSTGYLAGISAAENLQSDK
ncbi:NAD(P)/FAD-dependent oxidoreductase, partial [Peptostreptococcus anaerobius]